MAARYQIVLCLLYCCIAFTAGASIERSAEPIGNRSVQACVNGCNRGATCNNGDFAGHPFICSYYYYCDNGAWFLYTCDPLSYFDGDTCNCNDDSSNACLSCGVTEVGGRSTLKRFTEEAITNGFTEAAITKGFTEAVPDAVLPQHQIIMYGNFTSNTGQDFTPICIAQYIDLMNDKVIQMGSSVNALIGSELCSNRTSDEIFIVSGSSFMAFDGNQGASSPTFQISFTSNLYINDVESCAQEISNYSIPHANWGYPILPAVPNCPEVEFTTNFFNEAGENWICFDAQSDGSLRDAGSLRYGFTHVGSVWTNDQSPIDQPCISSTSTELYISTVNMVAATNNLISSGQLCAGHSDVTILTPTTFLAFQENLGISSQDYRIEAALDMTFADVYECADELSVHLSSHSNWITPIIPQVPGCPTVSFDPESFRETSANWIC